jgi:hypothetical protein
MPRRVLELKFNGNRLVERSRRRWFCQLPDVEWEELATNSKGKIEDFSSMIPHRIAHW